MAPVGGEQRRSAIAGFVHAARNSPLETSAWIEWIAEVESALSNVLCSADAEFCYTEMERSGNPTLNLLAKLWRVGPVADSNLHP
jgi:hypothetical protein